jgi:antirestriction protein ArdC
MNSEQAEKIAGQLVTAIQNGIAPWRKPWRTKGIQLPRNGDSGRVYNGINLFILACSPYSSPHWFTFNQARNLKAQVKKGERATFIRFVSPIVKTDKATGKESKFLLMKPHAVFNEEQIEGLPESKKWKAPIVEDSKIAGESIQSADFAIHRWSESESLISHHGDRAFYTPVLDTITLPPVNSFDKFDNYYSTAFHEIAHSTGHAKRDNRAMGGRMGSIEYAREELVAELTSSLFAAHFNFDCMEQSAAYLKAWIEPLGRDANEIIKAASAASRAFNRILGL